MTGVSIKGKGNFDDIKKHLMLLADVEVLAGFPEDTTDRPPDPEGKSPVTNAALAYIHDNGAPERNIPARPFMLPAMQDARDTLTNKLGSVLKAVLTKGANALVIEQGMHAVGSIAQLAIQNKIGEGIPPPLADSTLRARARKGFKGAGIELLSRSMGYAPSMDFVKPLTDTGEMKKSANYAIRSRKKRK